MNKLLRLTLILFIWLNAISYADIENLELSQVREYSYHSDGKLAVERIYDKDEILRHTIFYYYGKYGIVAAEVRDEDGGNKLFAYEYKNGKLVKKYKIEKIWNYSNGTTKYEAVGYSIKYEYNRYGNLVYSYGYTDSRLLTKTRYEYNSSGKLILATTEGDRRDEIKKAKCGYDSDGKLIEEVLTGNLIPSVNIKYEYDGNLLYSSNITVERWLAVKTKYEYNSAGQLIKIYDFGSSAFNGYCRPLHSEIAFASKQNDSFYKPPGFYTLWP